MVFSVVIFVIPVVISGNRVTGWFKAANKGNDVVNAYVLLLLKMMPRNITNNIMKHVPVDNILHQKRM